MIIGSVILANEVQGSANNQTILNGPNNVFPVLSTPALISFGALIVVSGMNLSEALDLEIEFKELEPGSTSIIIFKERVYPEFHQDDPNPTLSANLGLRNVRVNNLGYHEVILKLNGETLNKSIINIILAD